MTAYSVDISASSSDSSKFRSPLAFDAHDLWLGSDFDHFMDNLLDDLFDEIESDLKSVWSTNKSEQESAQISAQRSADAEALGLETDESDFTGLNGEMVIGSGSEVASLSATTGGGNSSATSASDVSLDHDLSDHSGFKHKGHFHDPLESRYSGTNSENLWRDTQGSVSRGTSGPGSTVSTQSIELSLYTEIYENTSEGRMYTFNDATPDRMYSGIQAASGLGGGVTWMGDNDNEFVFGTSWADVLMGDDGDDTLYGFEGDDKLYGGDGDNKLFGDGGDDILYAYGTARNDGDNTDKSLLSGGSGNDKLYGDDGADAMFGGPGHDYLSGGGETTAGTLGDDVMYGEGGDDVLVAAVSGDHELFGGEGNDILLAGRYSKTPVTYPRRLPEDAIDLDYVSDGNLDLDGGAGDDFIAGGLADDDISGGEGDDTIWGNMSDSVSNLTGAKEINAGPGNDIVYLNGTADNEDNVVKGGSGNDTIYANDGNTMTSIAGISTAQDWNIFFYGDEGHDTIFGGDYGNEYLWGGAGDDVIQGGDMTKKSYINGNEGNDTVTAGGNGNELIVRLGKGDDTFTGEDTQAGTINVQGGDGEDTITAVNYGTVGEDQKYYGGSGDDTLYGATDPYGDILLVGQGGKDLIKIPDAG